MKLEGHSNLFTMIPKVRKEVWDQIVSRHPKSLSCVFICSKHKDLRDLFTDVMAEIYEVGEVLTPMHPKIEEWHSEMIRNNEKCRLLEDEEFQKLRKAKVLVPRQSVLFKLDPVNALTVTQVRELLEHDAAEYARLVVDTNKDNEASSIGYLLDLSEKFHMILPNVAG